MTLSGAKTSEKTLQAWRDALRILVQHGPLHVDPKVIAELDTMPEAELRALRDEMLAFVRGIAVMNQRSQ